MLRLLPQSVGRVLAVVMTVLLGQAAQAQVEAAPREYRELLAICMETEDFLCAFDVLMEHGELADFPPVAVSVESGPTVFGSLMFAVIDRSKDRLDLDTRRSLAEQAIGYVFDAQPEQPFAAGPYLLLLAEICRELEDRSCILTAGQSVQIFWQQELWYFKGPDGAEGDTDVAARAEAFLDFYEEYIQ